MNHFINNIILCGYQQGFRSKHSCEIQLIIQGFLYPPIWEGPGRCTCNIVVIFKTIPQCPDLDLLHKLNFYGVRGDTLRRIQPFLSYRKQVVLKGISSLQASVLSVIPKDIILRPLLFLVFINHLLEFTSSDIRLFADEATVTPRLYSITLVHLKDRK